MSTAARERPTAAEEGATERPAPVGEGGAAVVASGGTVAGADAERATGAGAVTRAAADDRAAEYRRRGWWRSETFLDDLHRQARERPHHLAIAGRRIAESRTDTLTYAELNRLTDRFALALLELGVQRGDFVAVQLPNRWEMVPLIFASIRVGAVIIPISPICTEVELRHRLSLTEARVFITLPEWADTPLAQIATRLKAELPSLEHVLVVDGPLPEGALPFHDHFVAQERETWKGATTRLEGLALGADDPFVVLFTSGTTGLSKGVLHSPNTVHSAVRGYVDAFGAADGKGEDWVAAVSTPLVHYSGFAQGVLAGVMLGGTVAFQDVRRNEALLDLVERYGATLLYGPPATLSDVAASQRAERRDTSTLRHVVIGSAPVLQELADEVHETLGARAHSLWGMSENGPVTTTRPEDPEGWAARSNGHAIDAMETRIEASEAYGAAGAYGAVGAYGAAGAGSREGGAEHPVGRLKVRGASLALGYHRRPEAFAAELDADGWFDTGDLARDDGRGGIRIIGRARDAVLRDGRVAPMTELEAVIGSHPRAEEAALVGLGAAGGEGHGNVIVAVVVPRGGRGPTLDEVRERVTAAGHDALFLPDRVELVPALPKTLTGKVRKAELRERYATTPTPPDR
ncbi:cyclohexanecarboxylate-CoA ligase [Streptomyces cavourensis]|uniref:AMP-binding protein n=1 Tax=Streptomyces cavourensis TaxID=67258 RepID=UPI001168B3E1|nr:AMP-binding protein [Streptomyces cavourensis]TQO31292.1 cyclohexanecarboxylate-CoA ligase [Streptomyces cavourensis]GGU50449.1 cyclohexanecarboxylate-CoA ligase [Streptomyces cavourensis]